MTHVNAATPSRRMANSRRGSFVADIRSEPGWCRSPCVSPVHRETMVSTCRVSVDSGLWCDAVLVKAAHSGARQSSTDKAGPRHTILKVSIPEEQIY